jgi:hypothetical protein
MPEADAFDIDAYLEAQISLPKADGYKAATVRQRKHDVHGNPIGVANQNPILDTCIYEVQFTNGHVEEYTANVIAENLYAQANKDEHHNLLLQELIDHRNVPKAISLDNM